MKQKTINLFLITLLFAALTLQGMNYEQSLLFIINHLYKKGDITKHTRDTLKNQWAQNIVTTQLELESMREYKIKKLAVQITKYDDEEEKTQEKINNKLNHLNIVINNLVDNKMFVKPKSSSLHNSPLKTKLPSKPFSFTKKPDDPQAFTELLFKNENSPDETASEEEESKEGEIIKIKPVDLDEDFNFSLSYNEKKSNIKKNNSPQKIVDDLIINKCETTIEEKEEKISHHLIINTHRESSSDDENPN